MTLEELYFLKFSLRKAKRSFTRGNNLLLASWITCSLFGVSPEGQYSGPSSNLSIKVFGLSIVLLWSFLKYDPIPLPFWKKSESSKPLSEITAIPESANSTILFSILTIVLYLLLSWSTIKNQWKYSDRVPYIRDKIIFGF